MCNWEGQKKGVNIHGTSSRVVSHVPNGFIFLDISTIRDAGGVTVRSGVWVGLVDDYSGFATSIFVSTKKAMVEKVCELFNQWRGRGLPVQIVRCDNAGENKALEKRAHSSVWQFPVTFQYTSAGTPQHNAQVEKFLIQSITRPGPLLLLLTFQTG